MANGLFGGGNGTTTAPYLVEDAKDFMEINKRLDNHYKQVKDIDMSEIQDFPGIGSTTIPFSGSYDGQGFTIRNLTSNAIETATLSGTYFYRGGVFNLLGNPAIIQNVKIDNLTFNVDYQGTSTAFPNHWLIGGVVGHTTTGVQLNNITLSNSSINITATKSNHSVYLTFGGIMGYRTYNSALKDTNLLQSCSVIDCEINITNLHSASNVAIIAGYLNQKTITLKDCHAIRTNLRVSKRDGKGTSGDTAGIACSSAVEDCTVVDCLIDTCSYVGGIGGSVGIMRRCHISGSTIRTVADYAAGMHYYYYAGEVSDCSITNCTIESASYVAGGFIINSSTSYNAKMTRCLVKDCTVVGSVSAGLAYGGYVEFNDCAVINTTVRGNTGWAGGLGIGTNTTAINKITNCLFSGTVQGNYTYVGGLLATSSAKSAIKNSFFLGDYVKGLGGKTSGIGRICSVASTSNVNNYSLETSQIILE